MKKGTVVTVRMPRGEPREGKFVMADTTGARGTWYKIQPLDKTQPTFRARPTCVAPKQ